MQEAAPSELSKAPGWVLCLVHLWRKAAVKTDLALHINYFTKDKLVLASGCRERTTFRE